MLPVKADHVIALEPGHRGTGSGNVVAIGMSGPGGADQRAIGEQ
jgi:hypothetical protein